MMYYVRAIGEESHLVPAEGHDSPEEAVAAARAMAKRWRMDVRVFKLIETHYIKAPVVSEPVVVAR